MKALYLIGFLFSCIFSLSDAGRTCYGDIANLSPTGQRWGGVSASQRDISLDLRELQRHRSCYEAAASRFCIQAAVIAAIASRESRGGRLLYRTGGYGDHGNAWGIMQCDIHRSGLPCTSCPWNSCCHIDMMVGQILLPFINSVRSKLPYWNAAKQLQGGVAAYNFGVSNVRTWNRLDIGSTGNDYSNDVIARAKFLQRHGWN